MSHDIVSPRYRFTSPIEYKRYATLNCFALADIKENKYRYYNTAYIINNNKRIKQFQPYFVIIKFFVKFSIKLNSFRNKILRIFNYRQTISLKKYYYTIKQHRILVIILYIICDFRKRENYTFYIDNREAPTFSPSSFNQ